MWVVKHYVDVTSVITLYSSMVVEEYKFSDEKQLDLHMLCFVMDKEKK